MTNYLLKMEKNYFLGLKYSYNTYFLNWTSRRGHIVFIGHAPYSLYYIQ